MLSMTRSDITFLIRLIVGLIGFVNLIAANIVPTCPLEAWEAIHPSQIQCTETGLPQGKSGLKLTKTYEAQTISGENLSYEMLVISKNKFETKCKKDWLFNIEITNFQRHVEITVDECLEAHQRYLDNTLEPPHFPPPDCSYGTTVVREKISTRVIRKSLQIDPVSSHVITNDFQGEIREDVPMLSVNRRTCLIPVSRNVDCFNQRVFTVSTYQSPKNETFLTSDLFDMISISDLCYTSYCGSTVFITSKGIVLKNLAIPSNNLLHCNHPDRLKYMDTKEGDKLEENKMIGKLNMELCEIEKARMVSSREIYPFQLKLFRSRQPGLSFIYRVFNKTLQRSSSVYVDLKTANRTEIFDKVSSSCLKVNSKSYGQCLSDNCDRLLGPNGLTFKVRNGSIIDVDLITFEESIYQTINLKWKIEPSHHSHVEDPDNIEMWNKNDPDKNIMSVITENTSSWFQQTLHGLFAFSKWVSYIILACLGFWLLMFFWNVYNIIKARIVTMDDDDPADNMESGEDSLSDLNPQSSYH